MIMIDWSERIQRGTRLLRAARKAVALTGAGISTPSGIPDFRSSRSGLWTRYDPMQVASLSAFRYEPSRFFEWVRPLAIGILNAQPNAAHKALADLEAAGFLAGVITQNIDDLHRRAGSRRVFELHGHLRQATCTSCFHKQEAMALIETLIETGEMPRCPNCGGILKPDVVLFGEQLPHDVVLEARRFMLNCDLILIAGSSLKVVPAATLPVEMLNRGARLILVNQEPTYLDERADVLFHADVMDILPRLAHEVLQDVSA